MTDAVTGHGTILKLGDAVGGASTVYTQVSEEVTNIGGVSMSRATHDATHLGSGGWEEFIAGLKSGGEFSVVFNYVPSAAGGMVAMFNAGAVDLQILAPNGATLTFSAVVTGWSSGDFNNEKSEGTLTLKISGAVAFA